MKRFTSTLILGLVAFMMSGCSFQTAIVQRRHWQINDTIRATHIEQLLLNIVRLRYDDTPYFLQVSSISTQFLAQGSLGVSGTFPEGSPNVLGLSGGVTYLESPVVTWSLPDSREHYGRLLAPVGAEQLTSLANAGWDPTRVLRVGVKKMNRLRNKDFSVEEGITTPPSYKDLLSVFQLIEELRKEGLIDLAYVVKSTMGAGKIPLDKLDSRAIPAGLEYGLQFMTRDDPNVFEPLKLFKPLFLRFSKRSDDDPRAQRLRALLNLDPKKYSFGIVDAVSSGVEQLRSESGRLSRVFDEEAVLDEIVLNNRSMMEVLYFASAYVQVPQEQLSNRVVRDRAGVDRDWLTVKVAASEPAEAWVKVNYRGNWFYISADDLQSRTSFSLLDALFAAVVGEVPGAKPLLTLPVK